MGTPLQSKSRFPVYLVPIVIGMLGVLFAQQMQDTTARIAIVLLSVSAPLFAGGFIFSKLRAQGAERFLTLAGMALLCVGAVSTASGFVDDLTKFEEVPRQVVEASRWLGFLSLFLGLMALVFMIVRREEAINTVHDRFHNLAENMIEGLILSEPGGPIHVVNDQLVEMIGRPREQIIGLTLQELADSLGVGEAVAKELKLRAEGMRSQYEVSWTVRGELRHFWISGAPVMDDRGELMAMLATVRDITENKRMADSLESFAQRMQVLVDERTVQLRQSEERLRDLLITMNEGFVAFDEHFEVDFANPRFLAMVGHEEEEARGSRIFEYFDPSDRQHFFDAVERMRRGESTAATREARLVNSQGQSINVMLALSAGGETSDDPNQFSAVVTDVTTLKEMQDQLTVRAEDLEAANAELRALGRAKDTFLSNVTHELRTPLSTLHGYAEMLLSSSLGPLNSPQENAIGVMDRNLQRLGTLINEMIDFSRMEIRGVELDWTIFDFQRLAAECVSSLRYNWESRDIRIILDTEQEQPPIWGDRHRLSQVITNLVSNAIKFSPPGSVVTLRSRTKSDGTVTIDVSDQGIGIAPSLQNRVFEKFFQVDSSHNRKYEGAGIGLSIARSITRAHGGDIELYSTPDEGSRFSIRLPRASFYRTISHPEKLLRGFTIFVVEEQPEIGKAIAETLEQVGARVTLERSGHAAIREIRDLPPDLVIAGTHTGEIAPEEFIKRLRESEMGGDPFPLLHIRDESDTLKPNGTPSDLTIRHLDKPFVQDELIDAVLLAVHGHGDDVEPNELHPRSLVTPGVLIIDSDTDMCEWVATSLARRGIQCLSAPDVPEANEAMRSHSGLPPSIIFADIDLRSGGCTSGTLATELAPPATGVQRRIYGLTSAGPAAHETNGTLAGIIQKPFSVDDLMALIKPNAPLESNRASRAPQNVS